MKILVIGYYNHGNLGDNSYQDVMGYFFPNDNLQFVSSDNLKSIDGNNYDGVIVGGGDIINDYFNSAIKPFLSTFSGPKIAFSIGFPFPSCITETYLGHFDHIFTRNFEDLRDIQKVVGSHRVHFIPDITMTYKTPSRLPIDPQDNILLGDRSTKKCGIFLVGNLIRFPSIVEDIAHLISMLGLTYDTTLYCFDSKEDLKLAELVKTFVDKKSKITVDSSIYNGPEMINIMSELDFAVCMRYHSHVFCTIAGTPFMSISSTRKTRSFMTQAGLSKYQYSIELDGYGTPVKSNYESMREICRLALKNRYLISNQLQAYLKRSRFLLDTSQPSQLLRLNNKDICQGILDFIKQNDDPHNGARLVSSYVLGYPDSPYVWGMYEKFKSAGDKLVDVITDSINYLTNYGSKLKDHLLSLIRFDSSLPLYIDIREYQSYKGAHRGGWYIACEELYKRNSLNNKDEPNGIICDMYLDRTFHWSHSYMKHKGIIPYTSPWCGFIHHTQNTTYSSYNTEVLLEIKEFIQSLHTCRALFTLSQPLADYLRSRLSSIAPHVKIINFSHPIVEPSKYFSFNKYITNKNRKLINVGAWMRNPFTIYRIPSLSNKAILLGKEMNDYIPPDNFSISYSTNITSQEIIHQPNIPCRPETKNYSRWILMLGEWLGSKGINIIDYDNGTVYIDNESKVQELNNQIKDMIASVEIINYQPDDSYDELLSNNIVFLDLIDAAAVNTIIECIVRRTPIIINRIPGTIALLGDKYPLFYNDVSEIPDLMKDYKISEGYQYLKKVDSKRYDINYFITELSNVSNTL